MRKFKIQWMFAPAEFIWGRSYGDALVRHGLGNGAASQIAYWEEVPMSAEEQEFYRECELLHDAY